MSVSGVAVPPIWRRPSISDQTMDAPASPGVTVPPALSPATKGREGGGFPKCDGATPQDAAMLWHASIEIPK